MKIKTNKKSAVGELRIQFNDGQRSIS